MGFNISHVANAKEQAIPVKNLGLNQVIKTKTLALATSTDSDILITTKSFILDELVFSTNKSTGFRIRILANIKGVETAVADVSYDGSGAQGFFAGQIMTHGSAYFDIIEYDTANNRYKFKLKHSLTFAEGVKISASNTSATDAAQFSIFAMGREYD